MVALQAGAWDAGVIRSWMRTLIGYIRTLDIRGRWPLLLGGDRGFDPR